MKRARTALVIGGGIAGPLTAMALQRAGIESVVYEAHASTTDDVGSYLTVATNGLDAMRAIDADRAVLGAGFRSPTNVLVSGTGKRLGAVSNGGRLADGTVSHIVKRARLYQALQREAADRGIAIECGKRLAGADTTADGVVARFDDSTGVAGIEPLVWHMIFGKRAFFGYVVDPSGGTIWFANAPRPKVSLEERAATSDQQWQRQLVDLFADDHGPASELIASGRLELAADNTHDLPSVPVWHRGRMVIVGDAAHAPSPSSGQGASTAAEDAIVLARCLRDLPDVPEALTAYEGLRRRRVERIVAQGARTSSSKTPGPIGRVLRDLTLPLIFKLMVNDKSLAWLYDHHVEWDSPVGAAA
jgi:FAD-dependent urate hydroxylase